MLDDLDDLEPPFEVTPTFREGVHRRAARRRHRALALRLTAGVLLVALLGAGGAALAIARRDAAIDRVDVVATPSTDGAVNVLVLGADPLGRADTSVVVRFTPDGAVGVLTIPRDLQVPDRQADRSSRLTGFLTEGVNAYVDALHAALGLPIDHVVQLDFDGFRELVDALGGLQVEAVTELRDEHVGLDLQPGCHVLDGEGALQLVRARYVQHRDATGAWRNDPTGDLGRAGRAQALVVAALHQLAGLDPGLRDVDRLSRVLADHAVVDRGLDLATMADLARRLLAAGPERTTTRSLPLGAVRDPETGAALVVRTGGDDVLAAFGAVDPPPATPVEGYAASDGILPALPPGGQLRPCSSAGGR